MTAPLFEDFIAHGLNGISGKPLAGVDCPHCHGTGKIPAKTLGQRLRSLRAQRGLTGPQVAEAIGGQIISASNLSQVECDKNPNPRLSALRALAAFYGVSLGFLFDGDGGE